MSDLLIETADLDLNTVTITEDIRDGQRIMKFRGILSEADKLNKNRRIYPKRVLKEAFDEAQARMKNGDQIVGELEHATDSKVRLEKICVIFEELEWDEANGRIVGTAVPTKTPSGSIVEGLAKSGLKICFSTRCSGATKPYSGPLAEGTQAVEVLPGLKLVSIDVVANPSCQNAKSETVYESTLNEGYAHVTTGKVLIDSIF